MESSPNDQYAAFDFFVTAEHIIDWIYPDSRPDRQSLRSSKAILRVTSHIANGAKHFEAKASHHKSVARIEKERYVKPGYVEEGYFEDPIMVQLTEEEAKQLNAELHVKATWLAHKVIEYWTNSEKMV